MNLEFSGLNILMIAQIIVDLALICAILLIYKRLQFLDPKRLDELLSLLRENEAMVNRFASKEPGSHGIRVEDDVLTLHESGKSVEEIATLLNLTQAEVELTIERHRMRRSSR